MEPEFKFYPVAHSWVARHPEPKGVIQFIGGAFFGTFPGFFYEYLLHEFFREGYTIVAFPFSFTLQHWFNAIDLLEEQQVIRQYLLMMSRDDQVSQTTYRRQEAYVWVGHSLGCKYLALLELLANWNNDPNQARVTIQGCAKNSEKQVKQLEQRLYRLRTSIKNQASILIAPVVSDTQSAVRIAALAQVIDDLGWGVLPTQEETFCFIQKSNLFNLTAVIPFVSDNEARETVAWFEANLKDKILSNQPLFGSHLRPLGLELGSHVLGSVAALPRELAPLVLTSITQLQQKLRLSQLITNLK